MDEQLTTAEREQLEATMTARSDWDGANGGPRNHQALMCQRQYHTFFAATMRDHLTNWQAQVAAILEAAQF